MSFRRFDLRDLLGAVAILAMALWLVRGMDHLLRECPNFDAGLRETYFCRGLFGLSAPTAAEIYRAERESPQALIFGRMVGMTSTLVTLIGLNAAAVLIARATFARPRKEAATSRRGSRERGTKPTSAHLPPPPPPTARQGATPPASRPASQPAWPHEALDRLGAWRGWDTKGHRAAIITAPLGARGWTVHLRNAAPGCHYQIDTHSESLAVAITEALARAAEAERRHSAGNGGH